MGYYILHPPASDLPGVPSTVDPTLETWCGQLESGSPAERRQALRRLVDARAERLLTRCLASPDAAVVQLAASGLWECWHGEAGVSAREEMEAGTEAMHTGDLVAAAKTFTRLIDAYPVWAEAINKLATVLYLQGKPEAAIALCQQVVDLKPDHFGAWNGMAICAVQIENWPLALQAVRESLRLQPYSPTNRQLLHLVESRLATE